MKSHFFINKSSLARLFYRFPISSKLTGLPKGFYRKTEDWFTSGSSSATMSRLNILFPSSNRKRTLPKSLNSVVPWQFHLLYGGVEAQDPAAWVAEIPNGKVVGKGAVITPDNYFLIDVSREIIPDQMNHSMFKRIRLPHLRKIKGKVAVLSIASVNYWHWVFDLLPRVVLLKQYTNNFDGIDAFVVNKMIHSYQRDTLNMLEVPMDKIIEGTPADLHIKADLLIVPSVFKDVPSRLASRMLRDQFSGREIRNQDSIRLYISREDARSRRVLNEEELIKNLKPLGFRKAVLKGMSVKSQSELFRSAEIIVTPHGAGLTNTIFCRENTRIVEIFPPTYVNPCYWVLSDNLGLEYYYILGEGFFPPPPPAETDVGSWFDSFVDSDKINGRDIRVNIPNLLSLIEIALHSPGEAH